MAHSSKMSDHGETEEEEYFRLEKERHSGYVARLLANSEKEEKWNVFEHEYQQKMQEYQAEVDKRREWIQAVDQPDPELAAWIAQRPPSLQKVETRKFMLYCVGKTRGLLPRWPPKCPSARSIPWTLKSVWTAILWDHRRDGHRHRLARLREALERKDMAEAATLTQELLTWENQRDTRHDQMARLNTVLTSMSMADEKTVTDKEVQEASALAQELGFVQLAKILPLLYRQLNEFLANHPRSR